MNTEEPDELTREYQRASAADAGLPGKATRDAILAEARKAALRRQPAANDSNYLLRAVAGVAVIGVALLLWRQQDPRMPGAAQPTEYTVTAKAEAPTAGTTTEAAAAPESAAAARESLSRQSLAVPPPAPPAAVADASAVADNAAPESRAEAPATQTGERMRETLRPAAPAMRSAAEGDALLRDALAPALQNAITPPASAWVIRDANGAVLRSGIAATPTELTGIATSAQTDFPGQRVGPWTRLPAMTSAGQSIDVHVAELQSLTGD